jgi:hypothetical protein
MDVVDNLYTGYDDQVSQGSLWQEGYQYLVREFPKLDYINTCRRVPKPDHTNPDASPQLGAPVAGGLRAGAGGGGASIEGGAGVGGPGGMAHSAYARGANVVSKAAGVAGLVRHGIAAETSSLSQSLGTSMFALVFGTLLLVIVLIIFKAMKLSRTDKTA